MQHTRRKIRSLGLALLAAALAAAAARAQPAPGDPYAWFRGDTGLVLSTSGAVTTWQNTATSGTPSNRSLVRVTAQPRRIPLGTTNGPLDAVRFGGADMLWATSTAFGSLASNRTVFAALRLTSTNDGFLFDGSTAAGMTRARVQDGLWAAGVQPSPIANATNRDPTSIPATAGGWQVHAFRYERTSTNTQIRHFLGTNLAGTLAAASTAALGGIIVGGNVAQKIPLAVDVGELLVYDSALNGTSFADTVSYLEAKWGGATDAPMRVVSCAAVQDPRTVAPFGIHDVLELRVETEGLAGPLAVTGLVVSLAGTEDPAAFDAVEVYYTGADDAFRPTNRFAAAVPSIGNLALAGFQSLETGVNRFWVCLKATRAVPRGRHLDAQVSSVQFAGAEGARVPEPSDPAGALEVGNVPYRAILRKGGDDGVTSYRIPGLAVTTSGALIAVYDARWDGSGDLPANIDVALRRSTDRGVTWSAQQIILDFDKNVPGSSGNGVGDPCILVDRDTGAIWVAAFWSYGNHGYVGSGAGLSTNQTGQYVLTRSDDDGLTWSPPINITEQVKANTNWGAVLQGPGAGIQLRDGTLVFPSQCTLPGGASARAFFAYSTNHGASWRVSPPANPTVPPQFNENQLVELDDGRLMVSARVPGSSNKLRAWATYTPGVPVGSGTWSSITYANPDPICQASFCRYGSARDGHPRSRLLFANPAATSARTNMTIRLSEDEGQTWPVSRVLNPKPSGYSCLAVLDDGTVGLLYETGESSSIENLTFARFTLDWLTRADVDSDGDGISDYYESANGLSNGLSDAAGDLDGDGATNLDEFRAGTLANDFASVLQMDGLAVTGAVRVAWRSVPWRNYAVEESAEASESWTPAAGGVVTAISGRCATVAAASEAVIRFFRVSALP